MGDVLICAALEEGREASERGLLSLPPLLVVVG
jgi:hypothetical protein